MTPTQEEEARKAALKFLLKLHALGVAPAVRGFRTIRLADFEFCERKRKPVWWKRLRKETNESRLINETIPVIGEATQPSALDIAARELGLALLEIEQRKHAYDTLSAELYEAQIKVDYLREHSEKLAKIILERSEQLDEMAKRNGDLILENNELSQKYLCLNAAHEIVLREAGLVARHERTRDDCAARLPR